MQGFKVGSLLLLLTLMAAPVRAQTVIETYSVWDQSSGWRPFGLPETRLYGQSFTAPNPYLNSWSVWLRGADGSDASGLLFTANVGTWTGTAVGSVLWTSALTAGTASASYQEYLFNPSGFSLTTGNSYIFFLRAVSGTGGMQAGGLVFTGGDNYAGGSFSYSNDPCIEEDSFSCVATAAADPTAFWDSVNNADLAFRAEFGATPSDVVPEPATMTLLGTGLAALAAARRRKSMPR